MTDVNINTTENIKEKILKWFGHVCRKENTSMVYITYKKDFVNPRLRRRPPKRWTDMIWQDTELTLLTVERNASDRNGWRRRNVR